MTHTVQMNKLDNAGFHLLIIFCRSDDLLRIKAGNGYRDSEVLHQCLVHADLILFYKSALFADIHGSQGTGSDTVAVKHRKVL